MEIKAILTIEGRDQKGQLTFFEKKKANSFVRALIDLLFPHIQQAIFGNGSQDISNTTRSPAVNTGNFAMNAAAGDVAKGIVVGTGTSAVTISDYALGTRIAHGNAASQLSYGAMSFTNPTTSGSTRSFTMERTFTNNSGSQITITELGLYMIMGAGAYSHCADRTLYTYALDNLATVTFRYTVGLTV